MKKITTLILAITLAAGNITAQDANETASEQKATELLKKASARIKGFTTIEVDFTYIMENKQMGINETMKGKVFSKGDRYRMTINDNVFISDGRTVWNFISDLEEIHINTIENMEGGLTPTALLSGFEKEYKGKFIKQENHRGHTVDIIDLVPKTPQSFFKYRLALDARDQDLVYTIAYDRNGGTYTYNIDTFKTNQPIPDSRFVFNRSEFPAEAEVIDLR